MGAAPNQINVEYFYRLLYDCFRGACYGTGGITGLLAFFAHLWVVITILGYLIAFAGLAFIAYATLRIFQLRAEEHHRYGPMHIAHEAPRNARWQHIESLMAGDSESQWREAIIEADIMLGDILSQEGFRGPSIGDQLQQLDERDLASLNDAWEAHRVRNEIAHQGSTFGLSKTLAQRTIARYETVFRDFGVV